MMSRKLEQEFNFCCIFFLLYYIKKDNSVKIYDTVLSPA